MFGSEVLVVVDAAGRLGVEERIGGRVSGMVVVVLLKFRGK